ncbi:beta-ketoacyl synthase N-terminal-like domain-containing protein [Rhizobium leguminosarum]|nr:beta-ketoacyl synthase N-terminal-like domain-containing protein [Rhizobium leguminosarum]
MRDVFITSIAGRHPCGLFRDVETAIETGIPVDRRVNRLPEPTGPSRNWEGLAYVDRISRIVVGTAAEVLEGKAHDCGAGISLGTFYGSQRINEEMLETLNVSGPRALSANDFAIDTFNSPGSLAAIKLALVGPNSTLLTLTSPLDSIAWAHEQIAAGRADTMLAGGYDEITPFLEHIISGSLPALAEAACVLLLEDGAKAVADGRPVLAAVKGYGSASSKGYIGCTDAIAAALEDAHLSSADIDMILMASSGIDESDGEAMAIKDLFTHSSPKMLNTKAYVGHSLGAAGAFDVAYAASLCSRGDAVNILVNAHGLGSGFASLIVGAA